MLAIIGVIKGLGPCCCMVLLHGAAAWCCCMVLLHGAAAWCFCMVLLHGAAAWCCCMVLLHDAAACCCCMLLLLLAAAACCCWMLLLQQKFFNIWNRGGRRSSAGDIWQISGNSVSAVTGGCRRVSGGTLGTISEIKRSFRRRIIVFGADTGIPCAAIISLPETITRL